MFGTKNIFKHIYTFDAVVETFFLCVSANLSSKSFPVF